MPDKMGFAEWTNRFVVAFLCVVTLLLLWLLLKYDAESAKVSVKIEIPARAVAEEPRTVVPMAVAHPAPIKESKPPVALERPAQVAPVSRAPSFEEIKAKAEAGDIMAQFTMGDYFSLPVGKVIRDDYEGFRWYLKAARQGMLEAQIKVRTQYSTGMGTKKDYVEAYAWAIIATAGGDEASVKASRDIYLYNLSDAEQRLASRRTEQLSNEIAAEWDARKRRTGK